MLQSCAPVNNITQDNTSKTEDILQNNKTIKLEKTEVKKILNEKKSLIFSNESFKKNVTIILSKEDNPETVNQFINIVELVVYQKKIENISFSIKIYEDSQQLDKYLSSQDLNQKIFIGPLNSSDSNLLDKFCSNDVIFFSFSSNKELAKNCVFLINFFPENELKAVFNHFPNNSKIALLYPENEYGFGINSIIDNIADQSTSIIVNRASYNEDLSNAPEAIKELGKYELRKYELNRQKRILANKKDEESKQRLIKLERFQTTNDLNFTHVIIADYGLRLLQVAPLLPYYDIDPNIVRFVGTGAWDDKVFYDEPSLNGSIYPGIEYIKREQLNNDYQELYKERLLRTSTLPYDLVGLIDYMVNNNYTPLTFYQTIQSGKIKFAGIDGNFYFFKNRIERDLQILQIKNGDVKIISKQK